MAGIMIDHRAIVFMRSVPCFNRAALDMRQVQERISAAMNEGQSRMTTVAGVGESHAPRLRYRAVLQSTATAMAKPLFGPLKANDQIESLLLRVRSGGLETDVIEVDFILAGTLGAIDAAPRIGKIDEPRVAFAHGRRDRAMHRDIRIAGFQPRRHQ